MKDKKIILVSHGKLAEGMLHSIGMIAGENNTISSMGMLPGEHYQPMVDEVEKLLRDNEETQYIVIADLFGGSVCNGMTTLTAYPNLKLIAGMSMGLVIGLHLMPGVLTDEQINERIQESAGMTKLVKIDMETGNGSGEDFF